MSSNESYPQYVVTAVIVAHDGATWLPNVADALLGQTRAVQRVVAVDTGSRDRGGAVLASKFGRAAVFGMDRATGYGTAVAKALTHRAANLPVPGASGSQQGDRLEWIWLLHDDCEPAPDALEQLLRGAAETNAAAVLGPKLRDWSSREVILEAGITLDTAGRRLTGIEPREVDQGQHDGDRDALAVSSAGMLVRRDVWEQVGGFDLGMGLFMEDIDFCWRVHAAGYRVRVITDAICYHALAATKRRRAVSVGRRARMLDRRNGLLTLLGNLPLSQMVTAAGGNIVVSLLRIAFFLVGKRLTAALDEAAAATSVLFHPFRLIAMRRRRSRGRRAAYTRVKADLPPGRSLRRLAEFVASTMMKSAQADTTGAHHASVDPTEDDSMLVDIGLGKRLLTSPTLLTLVALLAVALVACRSLLGSGPLGGGSLVPAWGGASDLWSTYLQSFHPSGVGSSTVAPPYVAVLAVLSTLLLGKPWLAIDVLLIGCVPLAGMSAMLAIRRLTSSATIRVWASLTYALLPVATGVIAAGRFGSAVAFVLLPLIALAAGRVVAQSGPQANRAAWATGLLLAVGAAFVPLLWLVALVGCVVTAVVLRVSKAGLLRNLAIVALTAPVILLPWTLTLLRHPAALLLEAGLPQSGTPPSGLSGKMLILLNPGGPGLPPYWVTGGLLAVAFAALFAGRRRTLITAGWGVALAGMLLAIVTSHLVVTPPDGGKVVVWAGLPLAIAAVGLLLAASIGGEALSRLMAGSQGSSASPRTSKGTVAALIALVGCSAPALAAAFWISTGVGGPVHRVTSQVVPELVAVADGQSRQVRTLVLRSDHGRISYLLLRGPSPSLADASLSSPPDAQQALNRVVAALTTPGGGLAVSQSQLLADFDIGFVLVEAPIDQQLSGLLNDVSGLRPYSTTPSHAIWQLITPPARVSVLEPKGAVVPVASGQVGVSGAPVPAAGGTLMLAEPVGGWSASVNGQPLTPVHSPAGIWAQAFTLPPGGGILSISHSGLVHDLWLIFEAVALLAVIGLALPGVHLSEDGQRAEPVVAAPPAGRAGPSAKRRDGRVPATTGASSRAVATTVAASEPAASGASAGHAAAAAAGSRGALAGAAGLAGRSGRGMSRARARSGRGQPAKERAATDVGSDLDRPGRVGSRPYSSSTAGDRTARSGRADGPQSRAWPYQDDAAVSGAADRQDGIGRSRADQRSPASSGEWERPTGSLASRSPSGSPPPSQWSSQSGGHRIPSQPDRYELDRRDAGREPDSSQPARYERDDGYQPRRYKRGERGGDGYGNRETRRYERPGSEPDRYQPGNGDEADLHEPDRHERPSRLGRRRRDDRSAGAIRMPRLRARQSDGTDRADPAAGAGWPGAGGESLEPLPPASGRSQGGSHRAAAWRPGAGNARPGWDEPAEPGHPYRQSGDWDDRDRGDRRRSSAEADYEGDTW